MAVAGELCVIGQLVLRGICIVIPQKLRPRTLALAHEGHLGVVGTKQNLRTKVWWPGIFCFFNLFIHLQHKVHTNTELQRITN